MNSKKALQDQLVAWLIRCYFWIYLRTLVLVTMVELSRLDRMVTLYITIGDVDKIESETEAQNEPDVPADGTGGILRITPDGEPVIDPNTGDYILGNDYPLNLYYAYGASVIALGSISTLSLATCGIVKMVLDTVTR